MRWHFSPSFRTYPSAMDPRIEPMCNPIYFVDTPLFVSPVVDAGIRHSSIFIVIRGVRYGSDQVVSLQGIHWRLRRVTCSVVSLTAQWLSSRYLLSYWRILRMRQVFKNDTSYDADIYRSILFSFIRFVLQVVSTYSILSNPSKLLSRLHHIKKISSCVSVTSRTYSRSELRITIFCTILPGFSAE
ncbi:hypothetical protein CSKR_113719 [Clonorchis sinensis]|uniref:Uncharacterized protein n=1 Tax=Clonorchis sinensis TaxID=79923 RepID=A0A3R7G702_CLOSI|nr:hypothetical protein CSKR_113719 [Clonorchis sinensis]